MTGFSFEAYGAVDQLAARRLARDPDTGPLLLRVMFAAIGWSNLIGHAEFASGGLAMVLQSSDPQTGEMSMPNRGQVNTAIRRAEASGLVADGSSRFCLVTADWWEKAGGKGGRSCGHHNIRPPSSRRTRSAAVTEDRHTTCAASAHEVRRSDAVTRENVRALY